MKENDIKKILYFLKGYQITLFEDLELYKGATYHKEIINLINRDLEQLKELINNLEKEIKQDV